MVSRRLSIRRKSASFFALQLFNGYTREVTKHERSVRIVRIFRGERRDDSSILDLDCLSNLSSASVTRLAAFASFFYNISTSPGKQAACRERATHA